MTWDATIPLASTSLRLSNPELLANQAAVEDAMARNHDFPGTEGSTAGEHTVVELQDQLGDPTTPADIITIYNHTDELFARLQNSGTILPLGPIPSGTKMLFPQNAAPTSWTFVSENNDIVIMNQSTETNGGTTGGTWTISGVTVDGHTLLESEMPAHTHTVSGAASNDGTTRFRGSSDAENFTPSTNSTGGGGSHNHGVTADGNWRPAWLGVISCTKD